MENAREFQKNIYFIDYDKAFDCVDHNKTVENSERDGNTRPPDLPVRNLYASQEATVRIGHGKKKKELDMEQQTGSKQEKEYIKAVYCHPAYLTYMLSTS